MTAHGKYGGAEVVDAAGVAFREIVALVSQGASRVGEISAAIEEQLASTEELASSSEALAKMAEELTEGIRKFKV
jgi:methyl-accepting chemotaxis protein